MEFLWQLDQVTLKGETRPRLDDVSCAIRSGITAILGASGAGKTSLLNLLAGMEFPDSGTISRLSPGGRSAPSGNRLPVYWAPQGGGLWPHLSVRQHLTAIGEDSDPPDKLLNDFDLIDRRNAFPDELSEGEKARLSIARALAAAPEVLLFDEPLVHVDGPLKASGWNVVRRFIEKTGTSVVLTTHEPDVVLREAESVICLESGRVVYDGPVTPLYREPPDERCGRFLGPINVFTSHEHAAWLAADACAEATRYLRPERLIVEPLSGEGESLLEVVTSEFLGTQAETVLKNRSTGETRAVIHRPAAAMVVGTRVRLRVCAGENDDSAREGT